VHIYNVLREDIVVLLKGKNWRISSMAIPEICIIKHIFPYTTANSVFVKTQQFSYLFYLVFITAC